MKECSFLTAALLGELQGRSVLKIALLAICGFLNPMTAQCADAQEDSGTLTVSARSESGASVTHLEVCIQSSTGVQSAKDSGKGTTVLIRHLRAGLYQITALAPGYVEARTTAALRRGQKVVTQLVLQPAATAITEAKGGEGAAKESMTANTINNVPLNGRSTSDLVALEPGVIKARTQSHGNGTRGFGTQMEIFGSRPRQNDSRLDGISVNDYANGPLGNAIGISLGVDALENLSVLTTADEAHYGRSSGGYISSSTRSGTKSFHGSVFEYFRNSALDTRNYFDQHKPPFRRNQFGVSAGGPLWKNVFLFGDYEGIRQSQGITHVSSVPSPNARLGQLSTGTVTVDPEVKRYMDAFYPLPNGALLGAGDTGIYVFSGQTVTPGNHFTTRLDLSLSAKDAIYGVYMLDWGSVSHPDDLNAVVEEYDSRQNFLAAGYTHTFSPRAINVLHLGLNRVVSHTGITHPGDNPAAEDASFGIMAGRNAPRMEVASLSDFNGGLDSSNPYTFAWTSLQANDDITITAGRHSLQFGFALERMRDDIVATLDPAGNFFFNSLPDFLLNRPFSLSVALGAPSSKGFRQTRVAAYVQEGWRMFDNFSLNMGLRYEMVTVPSEVHGRLSALRKLTDALPATGGPLFSNPTVGNFAPRFGFAWRPFARSATVVSSSFGIFDVLPLPYEIQFAELFASPSYESRFITNLPAGSFPTGAYPLAVASPSSRAAYFQPNPRRNYVMNWNLYIEQQLLPSLTVKAGYVGSHGVHHIFTVNDANIVLPESTPQGYQWPSPAGRGTRLNPNVGRISAAFWTGSSSYNALVLQVRARPAKGVQIAGSYTWGKSIDTSSASISGNEYNNSISSPLWFNPGLNRGLSDFDIGRDLKVVGSWQIGRPAGDTGISAWALQGWQIGGVLEGTSGVPFTPGIAGDPLGVNSTDPGLDVPDVLPGPDCHSLVNPGNPEHYIKTQCFALPNPLTRRGNAGRNILIGPSLVNIDASLFKNNPVRSISDSFNVQFRAEFFNVLNHPNFDAPLKNRNIFDTQGNPIGNAGLIDSTQGSSREIQFALRLIW